MASANSPNGTGTSTTSATAVANAPTIVRTRASASGQLARFGALNCSPDAYTLALVGLTPCGVPGVSSHARCQMQHFEIWSDRVRAIEDGKSVGADGPCSPWCLALRRSGFALYAADRARDLGSLLCQERRVPVCRSVCGHRVFDAMGAPQGPPVCSLLDGTGFHHLHDSDPLCAPIIPGSAQM